MCSSDLGKDATKGARGHSSLRAAVDTTFDYVERTNFATLGTIGTLALILGVMLVLHQIEGAMNTIWQVAAGRSFLRKLSDYITLLVLMPLAVNIGFAASAFIARPDLLTRLDAYIPVLWLQGQLLKAIPIVIITGRYTDRSTSDMIKQEPNVRDFIEKPVKPQVLSALIHKLLKTQPALRKPGF